MIINLENIELIDSEATQYIRQHRDPDKIYTAHDEPHLRSVARLTELAGLSAGYCSRDIELSRIAGWFHDFERSMNESNQQSDGELSADAAIDFLGDIHQERLYYTSTDERGTTAYAILNNGRPPAFFIDRPDPGQWTLPERLLAGLFVADKLEANGVWVIARRSQFVAGARLKAEDADLPKYGLQPGRDEVKAILLESGLRITFINPESLYPSVFRPLTDKMYGPQRDFIHGLLAARGMTIEEYAAMILQTKLLTDDQHPNYLQTRHIDVPLGLNFALTVVGGLSDSEILEASEDLAQSSVEAVNYFSSRYQNPLEELVGAWEPKHHTSTKWREDMLDYKNGEWFTREREQLTR